MPFPTNNEWTIIDPIPSQTHDMVSTDVPSPVAELNNSIEPTPEEQNTRAEPANLPKLVRASSIESIHTIDDDYYGGRRPRRPISPIRGRNPLLNSSISLLSKVNKYDGIADLPFPARGSVYLTTFPFTDRDVKKWAWLFSLGVEDTFLTEDHDEDDARPRYRPVVQRRRDCSPAYDSDVPSVYLSRAMDTEVVPEDTDGLKYLIVTKNRHRPAGSKLLVAESRKAAGMLMYYEVLKGDSVMFVGATVGGSGKGVHPKKFARVEEVGAAQQEGVVRVIC